MSAGMVFLPSARACRTLGHRLLEISGQNTLLLPRALTPAQWAEELAVVFGLAANPLPNDDFRHLILAPRLAQRPWMADRRESAPGLAAEFIAFFDEVRRHRQEGLLLDPTGWDRALQSSPPAEAEIAQADLERAQEVWALYRQDIPWDSVDRLVALAAALEKRGWPLAPPAMVLVAGFGRLDPVTADLLRCPLEAATDGRLVLADDEGDLTGLFMATWSRDHAGTDPLAPSRSVERLMVPQVIPVVPEEPERPLRDRLIALGAGEGPSPLLAPTGTLTLQPCGDPEGESRLVAHRVAEILAAAEIGERRIAVAVPDPPLAARITAQLRDAGIDSDNTHGQPLSALPAGLLVRFILRAALTDLRPEPLLEVLTHPYVQLAVGEGHHEVWTLRLERMFRRNQGPQGGLAGLHRRAAERDQASLNIFRRHDRGMETFVTGVADAFAPLLPFATGRPRPWSELLVALREVWSLLAPDQGLGEKADRPDVTAVSRLLEALQNDAPLLPPVGLADFAADLGGLLAAANVPAHRARNLPVLVTGLVEARLEQFDHLIVAGLRDGVFPARPAKPLLLGGAMRARLGLPGWRDALGRDAELFLRLLHNAPDILLTWSTEDEGQTTLPSGFVSRLELVLQPDYPTGPEPPLWRREPVPWSAIKARQEKFRQEDPAPGALVEVRAMTQLSWSALRTWRDCSYRFFLERGLALHKEEEVQEEFGRLEYGSLVHEALAAWLDPRGAGYAALVAGDADEAARLLAVEAEGKFTPGAGDLPLRRLWYDTFCGSAGALAAHEVVRFVHWRPIVLERKFSLSLDALVVWLQAQAADIGVAIDLPDLADRGADIVLRGTIDRVDRIQDGTGALAVIDYKTGNPPSLNKVKDLDDLQVLLYAAAVEIGVVPDAIGLVAEGFYYGVGEVKLGRPAKPHLDAATEEGRRLLVDGAASLVDLAFRAADPAGSYPLIHREMQGEGDTRLPCDYCDFRGLCRLEERLVSPATGRKLDKLINRKDMF